MIPFCVSFSGISQQLLSVNLLCFPSLTKANSALSHSGLPISNHNGRLGKQYNVVLNYYESTALVVFTYRGVSK